MVEVAVPRRNPQSRDPGTGQDAPHDTDSPEDIARSIAAELEVAMGRPNRVEALCAHLRGTLPVAPQESLRESFVALARRLRDRDGPIADPVFALIERVALTWTVPWPLLRELFHARDPAFVRRALAIALECARSGSLPIDGPVLACLAERVDAGDGPWREPAMLAMLCELLAFRPGAAAAPEEEALALYLGAGPPSIRRLAARSLDVTGRPVSPAIAARLLGEDGCAFLAPLLAYTRAGHGDLLYLAPDGSGAGMPAPVLESLRRAVAVCGESLAREVITELGWARVSAGLECTRVVGLSLAGSIPFMVRPEEAPLLDGLAGARRTGESLLIVAHGGVPNAAPDAPDAGGAAARFRALNLTHATLLADIMDVAPLDRARVGRILAAMDRVVGDFVALFAGQTEECAILPGLYQDLKRRILAHLSGEGAAPQLSAELTRLVLAFDDPHTPGDVRTLHGLKRFLHQRGLGLASHLVEAGRATNRTVDLLLCGSGRVLHRVTGIEYVDFEPDPATLPGRPADGGRIPYPVAVVADGFGRQLLHGRRDFPRVRIFCYGNEVHYFIGYGAHPAFLRIDYSPPLLGGMIDLEFYGVSKYEMAHHPNVQLDALRLFFRRLEFDCSVEATRIHARYDKERALDPGDLHAKTEDLFRLVPYLMDLDWIVGGLALDAEARRKVAAAWAEIFALWGALPLPLLLTRDRRAILASIREGPAGREENPWTGDGPYRDRFTPFPVVSVLAPLRRPLQALGLELPEGIESDAAPLGQLALERDLLRPLRDAVARGELALTPEGPRAPAPERFERETEAERFARTLAGGDRELVAAGRVALLVGSLERGLRFRTTGSVNGNEVQRAPLLLRGERLTLHVLRDAAGIIRLAFCAPGEVLWRQRPGPGSPWVFSPGLDAAALMSLLRANGCLAPGLEPPLPASAEDAGPLRARFSGAGRPDPRAPAAGERRAPGLAASPGRAVGPARFGTPGRRSEDLDGAVLLAPSVRPEDSVFLYHCAGIVSTGGGILSHAGLIAAQFRKPALIVPGEWRTGPDGAPVLVYRATEYRQEDRLVGGYRVSIRRDIREREHRMREGDLVVVDADAGMMRVLGQERDALALHEGLRALVDLDARLARTADDAGLLALRGRRLRTLFLVERILARLADPVLACHAVEELLLGLPLGQGAGRAKENARLLALLVANPAVGPVAGAALREATAEMRRRARASLETAARRIPTSTSVEEILALREEVRRRHEDLRAIAAPVPGDGPAGPAPDEAAATEIPRVACRRLETLREETAREVREWAEAPSPPARLRHALRRLERIERVLGSRDPLVSESRSRLARRDERSLGPVADRDVLDAPECGFETHPLVGWKAANLAEVERLAGAALVPPWFVVTDRAFRRVLDLPAGAPLREAIAQVLGLPGLDGARKAARIRALWDRATLPDDLAARIVEAYRRLERDAPGYVAVRSSAFEEDTETVARAGEFDTFLFVRGEDAVLEHIRRAWCGLWTERAIHHRALLASPAAAAGGGVIVQRMVRSRAAGVVQTINSATGDYREMVVNAGLGLGEGIVSGTVAADHIVIAKTPDATEDPLRFRYATADKREQMVFNERSGIGTVRVESRYHQRLRPALEYIEMLELARIAARLEESYGHPLDIEFAIEDARLWILQARPVPGPPSCLFETAETRP